jgi:small subunit ribosomal protein S20
MAGVGRRRRRPLEATGGSRTWLCYHLRARGTRASLRSTWIPEPLPNIRQQEKRVRVASRQRLENLRYRSSVKTLAKRLEAAVSDGDAETIAAEHLALVRMIDKAASHGALHRNTASRKKSQAARLVAGDAS